MDDFMTLTIMDGKGRLKSIRVRKSFIYAFHVERAPNSLTPRTAVMVSGFPGPLISPYTPDRFEEILRAGGETEILEEEEEETNGAST